MFGIILFWLHYIVAGIFLYHILRCIYVKGKKEEKRYSIYYYRTDSDVRLKHPLWLIMVFIFVFFIPILNLLALGGYLIFKSVSENGGDRNPYYCKSAFTKKY